ncbi:phosphate ABC transporter substrate-binding protein PstS [Actinoplanes sp. KI2]|uniref:phosphate ABC transporter substrate-binding protein PstS n=1 Tax=Actinoplanes sp. KI2 TaxID=2983315 RepID=UPI0021D60F04|nr:phosphate ABC transporter substrate-binding protein PstS [Actinoplanes sp. KI2]MCU7727589.1 phosphate ABC transporter substrate-binding protein PstS [Actinoplanes sp. KI2]
MRTRIVGVLAATGLLAACSPAPSSAVAEPISCASGEVTGQGSSAQANAVSAWIRNYQVSCADATVSYSSIGSGAGVAAFIGGAGDFAGTDSPLAAADRPKAAARCQGAAIHLPMVVGPIALAYNVAGVSSLRLQPETIARIFDGRIASWNDPAARRDNPGIALPATPVRTVHRSDSSGTTDNFTKFLAGTAGPEWNHGSGSTWKASGGLAEKGSNQIVATIERTDGAIGYVEASYARFHNLPTAAVGTGAGAFTALTDEAAARMIGSARITGSGGDLELSIDYRSASADAYPIVLVTYEVVCKTGTPALVKSFLTYASSPAGQAAATRLGYAPLPEDLRGRVAKAVAGL